MTRQEDRQQVRTLLDVNVVVEAGAGTGKTTLLIERLCVALLGQGILAPRLVALTFTEKAAAEIKTRLLVKLQNVLQAVRESQQDDIVDLLHTYCQVPDELICKRAELALTQLDRSQIGTIHSFCADILKQYPLEAGLSPNAEIDTGVKAGRILETYWNQFLDEELGTAATRPEEWKEVLSRVSLTQLYECVQEMCSGKIEHFSYGAQKEKLIAVCRQRAKEAAYLSTAFLDGKKKPRTIEKALQQAARRFEQAAQWLTTGQQAASAEETISIPSAAPKDWDLPSVAQAKSLCYFAQQADPFIQAWILKVYDLLRPVVSSVRAQYALQGILSFDDLIIKTRDLLKHNLLVRRLLQEQYDAFYIDEFQDTDPAQGELLLFLAEQKGNGAATWDKVKLTPGKLFVVGDPKQSIYRFRGADITAYELFTDLILKQGGKKAYLRHNFRSVGNVVDLANQVCGAAMVEKAAFQPKYEPIFTTKPSYPQAVEMVLVAEPEQKASADDYRHNQAQWVAQWISQNVGHLTLQNGEKLAYKDIAILARASTTLWPYIEALRRCDIAFTVEENKEFYSRPELADFLNLLRVLDDPQNKIALVGVLRSPLGALTDEEIYQLAQRKELNFYQPSANAKAERLFVQLRHWAAQLGRVPLAAWIQEVLQHSLLQEACAYAYEAERSITQLAQWAELVKSYALQMPVTLGQFLARVEQLAGQELNQAAQVPAAQSDQAVSVMTIHKSKGLEFPVVIWVDISKKDIQTPAMRAKHLYSWSHNLHGLRVGNYADINLAWLEEQQREHARCEEIRLLYVALTRAREKMLLVGNRVSDSGTVADLFCQVNNAAILPVREIAYREPYEFIYKKFHRQTSACPTWDLSVWKQAARHRQAEYEHIQQQSAPLAPSSRAGVSARYDEQAMQLGSWVHAALQRRAQYPDEGIGSLLQATGPSQSSLYAEAEKLLQHFWQSEAFAQLQQMKLVGAELPFSLNTPQGVVNGVIDLLMQDGQGKIWVLDYKTDEVTAATAAQTAARYHAQLAVYQQAAAHLYPGCIIQTAIVFVRLGKIILLSSGA